MLRLARPVLIGAGGAVCASGLLYAVQQHQLSSIAYSGHISPEWGVETRSHIFKANACYDPQEKVQELSKAVDSLVSKSTNLRTKSEDWIMGYSDLLTKLGLALLDLHKDKEALEAFDAVKTIPFGSPGVKAEAGVALHQLNQLSDQQLVELYLSLPKPAEITSDSDLRAWGPLLVVISRYYLGQKENGKALNEMLKFHKSVVTRDDPLCLKQTVGGYIGQALWKLGEKDSAKAWLQVSEREAAKCGTNACKETLEVLKELSRRVEAAK